VAQAERRDLYLRPPLLSPDYARDEEGQETKRPRLTLRYLHELIDDIHTENDRLAEQIDTLSNQLDELARKLDALDVLRDDNELAAGSSVRTAREETAASVEAFVAGDVKEGDIVKVHTGDTDRQGAPAASRDGEGALSGERTAGLATEADLGARMLADAAQGAASGASDSADASEAFAKEWALIPPADAMPLMLDHGHGANELTASLQERMIENVKEAARIAEEIAAQAAAHAAGAELGAGRQLDRAEPVEHSVPPRLPEPEPLQASGSSISLVPAKPLLASGDGRVAPSSEGGLAGQEPGEPPAAVSAPPQEAKREQPSPVRETIVRYESSAAHAYIPPRAERHAGTKKRSFWSRLFRRASM